jgi:hypothetical protein
MALDETNHRLFVGCRRPPRLLVLDTGTGREVTGLSIGADADDIHYDALRACLYVSCGEGVLDVIRQKTTDAYDRVAEVKTATGARTSLFSPETNRVYVAVPHRGKQPSELLEFALR